MLSETLGIFALLPSAVCPRIPARPRSRLKRSWAACRIAAGSDAASATPVCDVNLNPSTSSSPLTSLDSLHIPNCFRGLIGASAAWAQRPGVDRGHLCHGETDATPFVIANQLSCSSSCQRC
jgi:hypothetical protein